LAATYYVDFASGLDSNTGTSKAAPWKHVKGMSGCSSVCNSATLNPGDTVIFKGGVTWTASYPWRFSTGSSSGNIIYTTDRTWYAGASWSQPVFDAGGSNPGAGGMASIPSGAGNLTLNDLYFKGCGVQGSPDMSNKCLVFENAHDITITGCTFRTYAWISMYFLMSSAGTRSNFIITGNDFASTSAAIWMASAQANTVEKNFVYANNAFHDFYGQIGNGVHSDGALHFFTLGSSGSYLDGFKFYNNIFYGDFRKSDSSSGMTAFIYLEGPVRNGYLFNNDVSFSPAQSSMYGDGMMFFSGGDSNSSLYVFNNTLVNAGVNGGSGGMALYLYPNVTFRNNVVYGMSYPFNMENNSTTGFSSDYNLWNGTSGQMIYNSSFQSTSAWQSAGRDTHGSFAAAQLVNPPSDNKLSATSPARGLGQNLTSLGIPELNLDRNGVPRPSTGAWDAGAYQGSGGGVTLLPPGNVTVTAVR
jgi:hypothetical protein